MIIGLHGPIGVGKDTVAGCMVRLHGYARIGFADALRREVARAFPGMALDDTLDRATKERPSWRIHDCADPGFRRLMRDRRPDAPWSPRDIMRLWGTEYRRCEDPQYWITRWAEAASNHGRVVVNDVRFPNEAAAIREAGGLIIGLARSGVSRRVEHASDEPLECDEAWNISGDPDSDEWREIIRLMCSKSHS